MGVTWTEDQKKVIELRNRNILVSAAAGSGKTAVLVERIMEMVCDEANPVDVDRLLVVTFTKAAAAEMKERVGAAIRKRLEAQPNNGYLQRQETLVSHAQITTIDSFCSYILRNHFGEIDLDPAFRVADEGELKLLKKDLLKELLEEEYEKKRNHFKAKGEKALRDAMFSQKIKSAANEKDILFKISLAQKENILFP